jgi:hypothetical protein
MNGKPRAGGGRQEKVKVIGPRSGRPAPKAAASKGPPSDTAAVKP